MFFQPAAPTSSLPGGGLVGESGKDKGMGRRGLRQDGHKVECRRWLRRVRGRTEAFPLITAGDPILSCGADCNWMERL